MCPLPSCCSFQLLQPVDWLFKRLPILQTPVLLPEKLSTSRCLVEIVDSASTDLAGDAGAVGRFGVVQHGQQQQVQLDLKGDVFCSCHNAFILSPPI